MQMSESDKALGQMGDDLPELIRDQDEDWLVDWLILGVKASPGHRLVRGNERVIVRGESGLH